MSNVITIASSRRPAREPPLERALLPWEDREEFRALMAAYLKEYGPKGPAEIALVEQLVWIGQRRRRLVIGERAAHMAALQDRLATDYKAVETVRRALVATSDTAHKEELGPAVEAHPGTGTETVADTEADEAMTRRAIAVLETGDPHGYEEALAALREDTRNWWEDVVGDDEQTHPDGEPRPDEDYRPYARNREQLLRFLKDETLPIIAKSRGEILRRPAIRLQAEGECLDPFRIDRILALDERLLRQFEKALSMLVRLKELRQVSAQPA